MEHILDNPIWNALISGNKNISNGDEKAKYFDRDIAAFAGLKDYNDNGFDKLSTLTPSGATVVLFTTGTIAIPKGWHITVKKDLLQMVFQGSASPLIADDSNIKLLKEKDVSAMIDLTRKTNPGPFLSKTIHFGYYDGFFDGDRLIAMAGQRLKPTPYIEISAVCTHPDYAGKGYAGKLISKQIKRIIEASHIPFLHVLPDNANAYRLYKKLGFQTRKEMMVYVLVKSPQL